MAWPLSVRPLSHCVGQSTGDAAHCSPRATPVPADCDGFEPPTGRVRPTTTCLAGALPPPRFLRYGPARQITCLEPLRSPHVLDFLDLDHHRCPRRSRAVD